MFEFRGRTLGVYVGPDSDPPTDLQPSQAFDQALSSNAHIKETYTLTFPSLGVCQKELKRVFVEAHNGSCGNAQQSQTVEESCVRLVQHTCTQIGSSISSDSLVGQVDGGDGDVRVG